MSHRKCPSREELLAYHIGELPEETAVQLIAHVGSCSVCQASLQTLDEAGGTLIGRLRRPAGEDPYAQEPNRLEFVRRLKAMAGAAVAAEGGLADEAAGEPPLSGRLGEYQILEKLGQGGMGTVYKACQTKLDKVVALKVLPKSRTDDQRAVARFEREMKAVGRLSHPHIVQALDAREIEGPHFLVMEYVEGLDLSQIVHRLGRLAIADACELIRQAALGL